VAELKPEKDVPFYYFSGMLDLLRLVNLFLHNSDSLPGTFAGPASQFANEILGRFTHVFRHDVAGTHVSSIHACRDIGKDFVTDTQILATHCFGLTPQEWSDPTEETAEKIAYPVSSLKVERSIVDGTDPWGGKFTSSLISVVHF